ncbi:MAG: CST, telomere maintenance, complex subunit CTC1-domain-containing protein [Benjaminiella poitrasii]|nr:MAG: CST, telomere maintenance, complex subunit CTC1-domain-containing protein [Benjaminiella poitrasii]
MNKSLTVDDLTSFKSGTNKQQVECDLTGILSVVSEERDDFERGTVILLDPSRQHALACLIDHFDPSIDNTVVFIDNWNYIASSSDGLAYLEFSLGHVYRLPPNSSNRISLLRACLSADSETSNIDAIEAVIEGISVLYAPPQTPAQFALQLSDGCVLFDGDDFIKYYPMFHIGSRYLFKNLLRDENRNVFVFTSESSCHLPHDNKQQPSTTPSSSDVIGTVTRIIDSLFGLYEINHSTLLCLFHHLPYSPSRPFRINTQLRLYHLHHITLFTTTTESHHYSLFDILASSYSQVLVACHRSHLDIIQLPDTYEYPETSEPTLERQLKEHVYLDCVRAQADFEQLVRRLEVYATLIKHKGTMDLNRLKHAYDILSRHITSAAAATAIAIEKASEGDWCDRFIYHDVFCSSVIITKRRKKKKEKMEKAKETLSLDAYLSVHEMVNVRLTKRLQQVDVPRFTGSNTLAEEDEVMVRTAATTTATTRTWLVCRLQMGRNGRQYLHDVSGYVPCVLLTDPQQERCQRQRRPEGLYWVRRVKLVQEDLTYRQDTKEPVALNATYVICHPEDLILLATSPPPLQFVMAKRFHNVTDVKWYVPSRLLLQQPYWVAFVLNKFPIQTVQSDRLYLESRIVVKLYDVQDLGVSSDPQQCVLVLSSQNDSLRLYEKFKIGEPCVIQGSYYSDHSDNSNNGGGTITMHLVGEEHAVFPVRFTDQPNHRAIELTPLLAPAGEQVLPHKSVMDVAALYAQEAEKDHHQQTYFFKEAVNVQGVLVTKRFLKGDSDDHGNNNKARSLYQDLGIGTGQSKRDIYLQVRQPDGLEVLDIYLNPQQIQYPLGLLVGARVTLYNLMCKMRSNGGFYCVANQLTVFEVHSITTDDTALLRHLEQQQYSPSDKVPSLSIDKLDTMSVAMMFRTFCYVSELIHMNMRWQCCACGSTIRRGVCFRYCEGEPARVFLATALVTVEDGLGTAAASVDGEHLVFRLLALTERQMTMIKDAVFQHGEVTYWPWKGEGEESAVGLDLQGIMKQAQSAGYCWLYCKLRHVRQQKRKAIKMLEEEAEGGDESDLVTAARKLKVIEVMFPDSRLMAYHLLKEVE